MKISEVFEVERAILECGNLTAAKLGYGLSRNFSRLKEVTDSARKQIETKDSEVKKYLATPSGKNKDELKAELSPEHLAEAERIESMHKELMESETEIDWYKIKLSDVPGMSEGDDPEKGVLPLAYLELFLQVGIIDDSENQGE